MYRVLTPQEKAALDDPGKLHSNIDKLVQAKLQSEYEKLLSGREPLTPAQSERLSDLRALLQIDRDQALRDVHEHAPKSAVHLRPGKGIEVGRDESPALSEQWDKEAKALQEREFALRGSK